MRTLAFFLVPLLFCSCPSLRPDPAYVAADRATFDVVAPIVRTLADEDPTNDPNLHGVNGEAVLQAIDTWELRLTTAEKKEGE